LGLAATCAAATKQVEKPPRVSSASEWKRNPSEAEVAQRLGMDVDRWRTMMLDLRNVGLISASTRSNENDDLPAPDFPAKPRVSPIHLRPPAAPHLPQRRHEDLAERYQKVVMLYYTNEMTMKEIGTILASTKVASPKSTRLLRENGRSPCKPTASPRPGVLNRRRNL